MAEKTNSRPSLSKEWKCRLLGTLSDVLVFGQFWLAPQTIITGQSRDCRLLLEMTMEDEELTHGSLQLALPPPESLELIKLSCWTLVWLKSLFPDWDGVENWMRYSADVAAGLEDSVKEEVNGYLIGCSFNVTANVLEYTVRRKNLAA